MIKNRIFILVSAIIIASMVLAACAPTEVIKTVVVTEEVMVEGETVIQEKVITATPEPVVEAPAFLPADGMVPCLPFPEGFEISKPTAQTTTPDVASAASKYFGQIEPVAQQQANKVYRVGVFEDITSLNFWQANGPDNTVWNSYMLPKRLSLYTAADVIFTTVPWVAVGDSPPLTEENGKWVTTIKMREDVTWSDGTPLTAEDVAFTENTILKFAMPGGNFQDWADGNYLESVEAVDPYNAKFIYHTKPGMARNQEGALQAPILNKAYWEPIATAAAAPIDALGENPAEDALAAAQAEAQTTLQAHVPDGEPLAGAFVNPQWETGAFLQETTKPDYFATGMTYKGYANGAYEDSTGYKYGTPEGDPVVDTEIGPFVGSVVYTYYGAQDAAILALRNGEVDYVINPLGLQRGLWESLKGDANLTTIENSTNGYRYLSFNNRRRPMNDCSFRQAVAVLIDKEFVTKTILQGAAFPFYSYVAEGNAFWYNPDAPKIGQGLNREERTNLAIAILEQAGYTWENDAKPSWSDEGGGQVVPAGGGLIMPDGTPVPPLNMPAPSPGYDPLRSTFAIWIETWLKEFGIPLTAQLAGFNVIVPIIFSEQNFDMYILGWSLDVFPTALRDFFSEEQAVLDGNNAGGYVNPEFEDLSVQLLTCETPETCKPIADQLQVMLSTEMPYVVLFDTGILEAYRSAAVEYPYTESLSGLQYGHQYGFLGGLESQVKVK